MSTCPTILVYEFTGHHGDAGVALTAADGKMRFAAAMVPDKREGSHWMATGATEEEARGKLEAMWEKEHPEPTEKQRAAWAKKKAANADLADDDEDGPVL